MTKNILWCVNYDRKAGFRDTGEMNKEPPKSEVFTAYQKRIGEIQKKLADKNVKEISIPAVNTKKEPLQNTRSGQKCLFLF